VCVDRSLFDTYRALTGASRQNDHGLRNMAGNMAAGGEGEGGAGGRARVSTSARRHGGERHAMALAACDCFTR
jgi:hypothetical protein